MSSPHESHKAHKLHGSNNWIDTWWPLLLIIFGLTFISVLVFFNPMR